MCTIAAGPTSSVSRTQAWLGQCDRMSVLTRLRVTRARARQKGQVVCQESLQKRGLSRFVKQASQRRLPQQRCRPAFLPQWRSQQYRPLDIPRRLTTNPMRPFGPAAAGRTHHLSLFPSRLCARAPATAAPQGGAGAGAWKAHAVRAASRIVRHGAMLFARAGTRSSQRPDLSARRDIYREEEKEPAGE